MNDTLLPAPVRAAIAAAAGHHDRTGGFPHDNFTLLRDAGLTGLTVPSARGGQGAGLAEAAAVIGALGKACPSTALVLSMQYLFQRSLARNPRVPPHLAAMIGRAAVERGALINALRVEPELGSPGRGGMPATTAHRTPAGWALRGHKIYATGAPGLTWGLVWAKTDEPAPRLGTFLVPLASPGTRIVPAWDHLGLRASASHDVVFEDVALPGDHALDLRPPEDWHGRDPEVGVWNAMLLSALYTGVAHAARDWLRGFLRDRKPANLGASLATLPRMREAMGRIEARLLVNARLIAQTAAEADQGTPLAGTQADLLKTVIAENAIAAVQDAVALCGNHALARANPLERHLRDVLCARIHAPQADQAHVAAGRESLEL